LGFFERKKQICGFSTVFAFLLKKRDTILSVVACAFELAGTAEKADKETQPTMGAGKTGHRFLLELVFTPWEQFLFLFVRRM